MALNNTDLKVIFFGDSLTQGWAVRGRDIWNKYYAARHSYNYGIAGDRTENLLWRMEHGELDGLDSKLIVLMIGTNNIGYEREHDIARAIRKVVDQILSGQPNAKVLLLGILPRGGGFSNMVRDINKIIAKYQDQKRVFFLDMSNHFESTPGNIITDLYFPDQLHLSTKGYEVWYLAMEPLFSQLYNN